MFEDNQHNQENERGRLAREWEEKIRSAIEILYQTHDNNQERINIAKQKITLLVTTVLEDDNQVMSNLDKCVKIENKDDFIIAIIDALKPLRDAKINDPEGFEEAQRQGWVESSNFTKINDLISYGIDEGTMHIHVAPNETTSNAKKLSMLKEGMGGFAKAVKKNEAIEKITGTSWIVAEHPRLLEKLGFTVEGDIEDEERERFFAGETRDIHRANINRDELLSRYL